MSYFCNYLGCTSIRDSQGRRVVSSKHGLEAIDRFIVKIFIRNLTGCWQWQAAIAPNGYGQFNPDGKKTSPHRFIWQYLNGPVPTGHEIDHLCRNRACCNPKHLRAVTHLENQKVLRKKFCVRGHELTAQNIYVSPKGRRVCRKCRSIHANAPAKGTRSPREFT